MRLDASTSRNGSAACATFRFHPPQSLRRRIVLNLKDFLPSCTLGRETQPGANKRWLAPIKRMRKTFH